MALPPTKRRRQEAAKHGGSNVRESLNITQHNLSNTDALRRPVRTQNVAKPSANESANRNIHSFFNTRTNLQTQSLPDPTIRAVESSSDAATSFDLEEDRIEEVEDIGSIAPRTAYQSNSRSDAISGHRGASSSAKVLVPPDGPFRSQQNHSIDGRAKPNVPWADAFPPLSLEELVVNKKKVENINTWMKEALSGHRHRRILVLRGPAGCGKSSAVRLLAQMRRASLVEWSNPLQAVFGDENYTPVSAQFSEFMNRGGQFSMLHFSGKQTKEKTSQQDSSSCSEILLVDEFPLHLKQATQMQDCVKA